MRRIIDSGPVRFALVAGTLFCIWMLLSGLIYAKYLVIGAVGSVVIALGAFSWANARRFPVIRFLRFIPWHLMQVVISNLRVVRVAMSLRARIKPQFVWVEPEMEDEWALTTLGCGLTLTPGTLSVEFYSDELLVHALDATSAKDIREGVMAKRVAGVFERA